MNTPTDFIDLVRVPNDVNGNGRFVIHFLTLIPDFSGPVSEKYALAVRIAKKHGGKKYRARWYGGGIVFQGYRDEVSRKIILCQNDVKQMNQSTK